MQDILSSAIGLCDWLPIDDLSTVVTELGKAFNGNGENLKVLVDSLSNLAKSGNDNLPQTISLSRSGSDVTSVVRDLATDVRNIKGTFSLISSSLANLSALSSGSYSTAPGDGTVHFGVVLETNNSPSCTVGYERVLVTVEGVFDQGDRARRVQHRHVRHGV